MNSKGKIYMKKFIYCLILSLFIGTYCIATEVQYGGSQPVSESSYYANSERDEGTSFTAKTMFVQGNILLRKGKYREAIDSYYGAKELFESIGDTENAQKSERAYDEAIEMRCEFGDYCM